MDVDNGTARRIMSFLLGTSENFAVILFPLTVSRVVYLEDDSPSTCDQASALRHEKALYSPDRMYGNMMTREYIF